MTAGRRAPQLALWMTAVASLCPGALSCRPTLESEPVSAEARLEQLFRERRSGAVVEGSGTVARVLADDLEGSRHQRFILRIGSVHTLLVSHNIDLAPRIERLAKGDLVAFRGQYEWNERGGVIHWTHHDPSGERPGGWLRHGGVTHR